MLWSIWLQVSNIISGITITFLNATNFFFFTFLENDKLKKELAELKEKYKKLERDTS